MSDDQVQEIKDRIDIVDLVGQYVPLKRAGVNHKGLCPFHREKSPSFMVNNERQIFKCFGCDEGGDVLTFLQKMEGLTFPEALELLADRVGMTLDRRKAPEQYAKEKDEKSRLFRINVAAAKFFHHILVSHPVGVQAREYFMSRTVNAESIKSFQLGYAPDGPALSRWLTKQGFSSNEIRLAGSPDRFHHRVMFPIRDTLGTVVGFTGRLLPDGDTSTSEISSSLRVGAEAPKYYNTPETPIFHKSRLVYGLAEAKQAIRQEKSAVFVEGQMDVVLSHQADVRTAVASSGTAITLDHLKTIKRYTNHVRLAFDADPAGRSATIKTLGLVLDAELAATIVRMPTGCKDAGEVIERDASRWSIVVAAAEPAMDWLIQTEVEAAGLVLDGPAKKAIAKTILPLIARALDPVEQAHYAGQLARALKVPEQSLLEALRKTQQPRAVASPVIHSSDSPAKSSPPRTLVEQLAGLVALHPVVLDTVTIDAAIFPAESFALNLYTIAQRWYTQPKRPDADSFQWIRKQLSVTDQTQFDLLAVELSAILASHEPAEIALELATRVRRDGHESLKSALAEQIRTAEEAGDRARVKSLMQELQTALKQ